MLYVTNPAIRVLIGIFVNDNNQTITVFQSRIYQPSDVTVGDKSLREFAGTLTQFDSASKIETLINAAGTAQVARLAHKLDLVNRIATHELLGEFVTNLDMDANGIAFLDAMPQMTFVGKTALQTSYISDERVIPPHALRAFDIVGFQATQYTVDADTKAVIAPIKASELVAMEGIADQSVFAFNVAAARKTQVNKDIVGSWAILLALGSSRCSTTGSPSSRGDGYTTRRRAGVQSLTALYDIRNRLTADLRVLVNFIKMDPASAIADKITRFSNNQNGVKPRDFKANHPIQIRLQNEFDENYEDQFVFEIKRGELLYHGRWISDGMPGSSCEHSISRNRGPRTGNLRCWMTSTLISSVDRR